MSSLVPLSMGTGNDKSMLTNSSTKTEIQTIIDNRRKVSHRKHRALSARLCTIGADQPMQEGHQKRSSQKWLQPVLRYLICSVPQASPSLLASQALLPRQQVRHCWLSARRRWSTVPLLVATVTGVESGQFDDQSEAALITYHDSCGRCCIRFPGRRGCTCSLQ